MRSVTVLAPAKLNLTLDVTGTGGRISHAGYDHGRLSACGSASLCAEAGDFRFRCPAPACRPTSTTPPIKRRWRFSTARASWRRGHHGGKACARARGHGGGSADAAAVLVGLNELYGARLSAAELCALGAQVGADVPFSIVGGTARVTGVGDILEPLKPCRPAFLRYVCPRAAFPRRRHMQGTTALVPTCVRTARLRRPPSHGAIWRACARR